MTPSTLFPMLCLAALVASLAATLAAMTGAWLYHCGSRGRSPAPAWPQRRAKRVTEPAEERPEFVPPTPRA
jgi:hypothetical protein